ncbi:MAG TPA: ATP-grasp domain-containing protein, partial [Thermodesulfobacteriota bacterium]
GVATPAVQVARSAAEAREAAQAVGQGGPVVVKALIPAGKRGKAGAVRRVDGPAEAEAAAAAMLGTTVQRFPVDAVLVSAVVPIERELFASITFDSQLRQPIVLFSASGGVDVETLAEEAPGALHVWPVDILKGLRPFEARERCAEAGLTGRALVSVADALAALYRVFRATDAQLVEVNPLALGPEGEAVAVSAVVSVDDQALWRHPELAGRIDPDLSNGWRPLTPLEREIRAIDREDPTTAIRFNEFEDGDIGFMMTGGGSGLLSFDAMLRVGGRPATSFDITPGQVEEKMRRSVAAVLRRPGLKGLIVGGNISNFIPIDIKVRGVVRALVEAGVDTRTFPVVFRFDGPNIEEARRLAASLPGVEFLDGTTPLDAAVKRIVELAYR